MGPWVIYLLFTIASTSLLGPPAVWRGRDPQQNRHPHYKPDPVAYRSWFSSPEIGQDGVCHFTGFALVTREHLMRLRIDGVEQLVDWSWSWESVVPPGMIGEGLTVEFVDAVTGKVVAAHELSAACPVALHPGEEWR